MPSDRKRGPRRYPALAVPNGFYEPGSPATITFYGRPFSEGEILALGKAYQDAAGFHLKRPKMES